MDLIRMVYVVRVSRLSMVYGDEVTIPAEIQLAVSVQYSTSQELSVLPATQFNVKDSEVMSLR